MNAAKGYYPRILSWVITACLAYIMLVPVGNNQILLPVLAVFGVSSLGLCLLRKQSPATLTIVILVSIISIGVYGTVIGTSNPGLFNGVLVWFVAPLLFGFWVISGDLELIKQTLLAAAFVTALTSILVLTYFILASCGLGFLEYNGGGFFRKALGMTFEWQKDGRPSFGMYGISTLVSTGPMFLTAMLLPSHPLLPPKWLSASVGLITLLASVLIGRAAITLTCIAVPLVVWILWRVASRERPRKPIQTIIPFTVLGMSAVTLAIFIAQGNTAIASSLKRAFSIITNTGQSPDDVVRIVQSKNLIDAWSSNPFFGQGLGAVISGYQRSDSRPWNFEMQYHLILFQTGLIGATILLVALISVVLSISKSIKLSPNMVPIVCVGMAGMVSMLIANATNPYLQAPGNMWPVYFLLIITNVILVSVPTKKHTTGFNLFFKS